MSLANSFKNDPFQQTLYWVCKEWKCLPTEDRFQTLTIDQIMWLRAGDDFMNSTPEMGKTGDTEIDALIDEAQGRTIINDKAVEGVNKLIEAFENGDDIDDWEDITDELLHSVEERQDEEHLE